MIRLSCVIKKKAKAQVSHQIDVSEREHGRAPAGRGSSTGSCLPRRRRASALPRQRSSRRAARTQKTRLSWKRQH